MTERKAAPKRRRKALPAPPRRRKKRSSRLTDGQLAKVSAKALETVIDGDPDKPKIRAVHWRYLRAKLDCLDAGQPLTHVNHAKHAGVSRIAIWKLQQKYPWLDAWTNEVMRTANGHRWGSIERRMAHLAEQGHVAAADQYCKMQGGHYTRQQSPLGGEVPLGALGVQVVNNILVPRPDYGQAQLPPAPAPTAAASSIPTVTVSR